MSNLEIPYDSVCVKLDIIFLLLVLLPFFVISRHQSLLKFFEVGKETLQDWACNITSVYLFL